MKPGRNELCPCGSGKKFKKCCGSDSDVASSARDTLHVAHAAVMQKLLAFTYGHKSEKKYTSILFERFDLRAGSILEEWEQNSLTAYGAHGLRADDGRRSVDRFVEALGGTLSPLEREAVESIQAAWPTLFEIEKVHLGEGVDVQDVLSGERLFIREVSATYQLKRWDLDFGWIEWFGDHYEMTGAGFLVPRIHRDVVLQAFLEEMKTVKKRRPGMSDREVAGEAAWAPQLAMRRASRAMQSQMPEFRNFDGEDYLFCEARYPVGDLAEIRRKLAAIPAFEEDGAGYIWGDRQKRDGMMGDTLFLGRVWFDGAEVVLETNSRERLEGLKQLLALAKIVRGKPTTERIEHPKVKLGAADDRPPAENADAIPPEVKAEIMNKMLAEYYANWLDSPVPALGGKTPRKAVRSKKGRAQVQELLKDIENSTLRMEGEVAVDFDGMRRELGLAE